MRRLLRLGGSIATAAVLTGVITATGVLAQDQGGDAKKTTFIVGQVNDVRTFNPLKAIESPEYETWLMVYDLLMRFDKDTLEPTPGVATKWEQSSDGLTWTFTIRDDVTWNDGQPLTAHDVAFTYNYILENNFSTYTTYLPFTDSITAPDDTTLVWKTTKPTTAPIAPPYIPILPEHVWSSLNKDQAKEFANFPDPVGSGPFRLVEWQKGDFWRLEANPDYWGGAPNVDEVIFRVFKNEEAMVQALKSGEVDIIDEVPADLFQTLQNEPGITAHMGSAQQFTQMSFNQCYVQDACKTSTGHPALKDHNVRLAVAMAIDKQELVDRVLRGFGTPGTSVIPPIYPWHWDPPDDEIIPFDIDGANQLLDDAGYLDTDGDGVREMPGGGEPLQFRFIVRTEDPDSIKSGHLISGWLKQIGISTQTEAVTDGKLTDIWLANDFDLYIWGWAVEPDPDFQLSTYTTDQCGVWSDTCFSNDQYDGLWLQQKTSPSRDARLGIVQQMQQVIYEDIPEIVLYYDNDLQAYRSDKWTGLVEQPAENGQLIFQYGDYTYLNVRPVAAGATTTTSPGISAGVWVGIVVGIVVVIVAVALIRRRGSEQDRA